MKKGRKSVRAAVNMELLHRRGMEDLGHLIETLLEAEATSACFDDVVHRGCPYKHFGSLVGLLGSLTSDCLATCRQRAWVCLGYLLQMQAKRMKVPQTDEIWCLCEELNSPHTETSAETCTEITKAVCRCIPAAQAVDFLTAVLGSLLHVMPPCARAVWKWVFVFLVECRKEIVQEVPKILDTLYSYMQQSTHRPFLLHAVFLLTRFHQEPVISSLLQKSLFMDSDTVELWRSLGRSILGIRILRCLAEKLNRAGNDRPGTGSSTCERHDRQTALETLTITCAISEVVLALRSTEELRQLLPHLLPSLLRWASEMLGEERLLLLMSSWGELFLECQMHVEKPCRVFLSALELVLGKCMAQKWMQLLVNWAVWARLEDPLAHPEGVCLLSRVLLHAGLVSPCLVKNLLPWLDSCSVKLRVTATAFFSSRLRRLLEDLERQQSALEMENRLLKKEGSPEERRARLNGAADKEAIVLAAMRKQLAELRVLIARYSYDAFNGPNERPELELPLVAGRYMYIFGDVGEDGCCFVAPAITLSLCWPTPLPHTGSHGPAARAQHAWDRNSVGEIIGGSVLDIARVLPTALGWEGRAQHRTVLRHLGNLTGEGREALDYA
ncbi:maestro heat-like repeat-containing protein family member 2B [Harpia harpyja]|uniref:maestro heat-like repeat-containing protein family member 2B n=1 Tax=Harpia harpyja TaxID=202280 RepID=UPI0022B12665|nr:maestro heat-like repeat-containing protein family member 2B [Harpia harpyja]